MSNEKTVSESASREQGEKPIVTAGQHIHKWGTYLSVDWMFNTLCGVGFHYFSKYTHIGRQYWSGPIQGAFKKILSPIITNKEALGRSAGLGGTFMSIIAGGMFTVLPIAALEEKNNRIGFVKWLDEMIYGKEKVANDPKFQESYEAIKQEPEKDQKAVWLARGAALAPLLAIVLVPSYQPGAVRKWFHAISDGASAFFTPIQNGSKWVARRFGFSENSFKDGLAVHQAKEIPVTAAQKWNDIHEATALDFGLGLPYAGLHAMFIGMFAKGATEKKPEHKPRSSEHLIEGEKTIETSAAPAAKVRDIASRERLEDAPALEAATTRV